MNDQPDHPRGMITSVEREKILDLIGAQATTLRHAADQYQARGTRVFNFIVGGCFVILGVLSLIEPASRSFALIYIALGAIHVGQEIIHARAVSGSRSELKPLFAALEALISRAAFLEDHADLSESERLRFRARIGEGESALEYADWVMRRRTRFLRLPWGNPTPWTSRHFRTRTTSL